MNRINLICLGVSDMNRSRTFYRDGLGFTTPSGEDAPKVVFFSNAGTRLELYPLDELDGISVKRSRLRPARDSRALRSRIVRNPAPRWTNCLKRYKA